MKNTARPPPARAPVPIRIASRPRLTHRAASSPAQRRQLPAARGADPRALARARRLPRVDAPPRGRAAVRLLRGPADGQRPARLAPRPGARVQGRLPALQDDAGLLLERKGGWDCHGLPVEIAVQKQLGIESKDADRGIRDRGVQREVPRVGVRVPRGLDAADRADRLLGRPRAPLPHARHRTTSSRSGGRSSSCGTRTCSTRASRSSRTARATARRCRVHEVSQGYKDVEDPSVYVRYPVTKAGGRAARGRHAARLDDDAVDAGLQRRRRRRPRADLRARRPSGDGARRGARRARARRGRRGRRPLQGRGHGRRRPTSRRSRSSRPPSTARRATPCCPPTSSPPRTAPASCTPRSRSARTTSGSAPSTGLNVINPVRADGTYDERIGPYEGASSRTPTTT